MSDDDLSQVVIADTRDRMDKAVEHARADFATVRSGRATPGLVEHLRVDVYGSEVELRTIAGLSVPEARLLVISPYDKTSITRHRKGHPGVGPRNQPVERRGGDHVWCSRLSPRRGAGTW